jgi:hypothetical protein
MYQSLYPQPRRGGALLAVVGWLVAVAVGIWLVWYGFTWTGEDGQPEEDAASATSVPAPTQMGIWPTATPLPPSPTLPPAPPTATPVPMPTPEPTAIPATASPVPASIVAGEGGVNVRSGPSTAYTRLGYLEPGTQAEVIGRYSNWWQIRYDNASAWVSGDWVTASNVDGVPQVQPPAVPTAAPATAAPTAVPPTATSVPAANFRGLVPDKFEVEGAPGPYTLGQEIRFQMCITNENSTPVEYKSLGVWVQETGAFQKSWTYSQLPANRQFCHPDQMHDKISAPGTYNLWLAIEFLDGESVLLAGPVVVTVQ